MRSVDGVCVACICWEGAGESAFYTEKPSAARHSGSLVHCCSAMRLLRRTPAAARGRISTPVHAVMRA